MPLPRQGSSTIRAAWLNSSRNTTLRSMPSHPDRPWADGSWPPEKCLKELLERTEGLDRLGRPVDQAKVIEFLLSPLADYVSGQTITVDGG